MDYEAVSNVFRDAKEHLWNGKNKQGLNSKEGKVANICAAIGRTGAASRVRNDAKNIVMWRLVGAFYMQGWLRRVGRVAPDDLTAERVQKHRYDWLDMLEKEFMRYAIAECFKKAKKKLRMPDGKRGEVYICLAILETNCSRFVKPAAKAVIEGRMGFSDFSPALEYWLNSKGHAAPWECTQKTMQTYRHAWLDALIEEFGG